MNSNVRLLVFTALFIALGVVIPMAFHMIGVLGPIFLPMHIPVFVAGLVVGPFAGMIVGGATPIISSLLTGMPPVMPMLPIMFVELTLYGLMIGYLNRKQFHIYISLLVSMLVGRVGAGLAVWGMVHLFHITQLPTNPIIFVGGSIITGIPGVIIQLVLIPMIYLYLKREVKYVQGVF